MTKTLFKILSTSAFLVLLSPLVAAQSGAEPAKSFRIAKINEGPVIDGLLNDPEWAQAEVINDFHQIRPVDGGEPSERTEIRVMYNKDYLYISGRIYDNPEQISVSVMKHGQGLSQDDRVAIILDPFNSGRTGYRFETNAAGIRHESLYTSISSFTADWDIIWDTASQIDEEGWTFEMAIPFKSLPFSENIENWGINFARAIRRNGEEAVWVSRNRSYGPNILGEVTGMQGMDQGIGLDVVPSLSVGQARTYSPDDDSTIFEPSLDAYYRLTPSLNASLTINTDFSSAELDDRQVNLSRFNLFLPEKRDFFLNDSDLFSFGRIGSQNMGVNQAETGASGQSTRPFFSRRIGLSATGGPVDLNYGVKLSGRVGRWTTGTLAVRQAEAGAVDASNLFISRIQADVLQESSVGVVFTQGDPTSNLDNSVIGADFLYLDSSIWGDQTLEAQAWVQQSDTEGLSGDDMAFGAGFSVPSSDGFKGGMSFKEVQANFNPALGFVSRTDVREYAADLGYTHFFDSPTLQSVFTTLNYYRADKIDGDLETETIVFRPIELKTNSNDELQIKYQRNKENVVAPFVIYSDINQTVTIPAKNYQFDEYNIEFKAGNQREVSGRFNYIQGDFYSGEKTTINSEIVWRPTPRFNTSLKYDWNNISLPQGDFATRILQVKAFYAFSLELTWDNLIQYDTVSEVLGFNSRLRWTPKAGQEGFIVLNHAVRDFDKDNKFASLASDLTVKFSYTFRF